MQHIGTAGRSAGSHDGATLKHVGATARTLLTPPGPARPGFLSSPSRSGSPGPDEAFGLRHVLPAAACSSACGMAFGPRYDLPRSAWPSACD